MPQPVQDSLALIQQCQKDVNQLLTEAGLSTLLLHINSRFNLIITHLNNSKATLEPLTVEKNTSTKRFQPITHVRGKLIQRPSFTKPEAIAADMPYVAILREKGQKLYDNFVDMKPDVILRDFRSKEGQDVIRTVAKMAGLEDFKEAKLTVPYMEEIALAIMEKEEGKEKHEKFKEDLNKTKVTVGDPEDEETTLPADTGKSKNNAAKAK